jgi:hypothetical protein
MELALAVNKDEITHPSGYEAIGLYTSCAIESQSSQRILADQINVLTAQTTHKLLGIDPRVSPSSLAAALPLAKHA